MKSVLSVQNVEKYYGNQSSLTKALDNISFNVDDGEFVSIMGASGSGKTTLLNCIGTIDPYASSIASIKGWSGELWQRGISTR